MEFMGYDKDFRLTGKVALVTGGGAGNREGDRSALRRERRRRRSRRSARRGEGDGRRGRPIGRKALPLTADITKTGNVTQIVEKAGSGVRANRRPREQRRHRLLDDAENLKEEDWDKTMAINLKAPFIMAQCVGREMIKRKSGKIVNLASQAGIIALDRHVAYSTSKAGIIGLTRVLAMEWAEFDINVNAISPTVVLTELGKKAWAGEVGEAMKMKIPVRRFGYPEEVAAVALFLASDAAT